MNIDSNPGDEIFSKSDLERLRESAVWRQEPRFVEGLCRMLCRTDPMGVWSGENPHRLTEYLVEAEQVVKQSGPCVTHVQLEALLRSIFAEAFDGMQPLCNWVEVTDEAWSLLVKYKRP